MNWFQRNFKTIIYCSFLVPILTVAIVSISHVTKWYGISNPVSWAVYLSVGVEIAALSALAAISAQMGKKVYFPFAIVTLIQFIGNIFFAYQYIDINSVSFKDWVDMVDPLVSYLGVESGNIIGHKRFLALFAGGMLPLISLSFLHMLVKFEEEEKKKTQIQPVFDIDELSIQAGKKEAELDKEKWTPTEEDIKKMEKILLLDKDNDLPLNEENFYDMLDENYNPKDWKDLSVKDIEPPKMPKNASEMMITTNEDIITSIPADDEISDWDDTLMDGLEVEEFEDIPLEEPKINRLVYTKRDG
jgi:hypothetical protein